MAPEFSRNAVPPSEAAPQPGLVLAPGPEGWWDSERVSGPSVMRGADGVWKALTNAALEPATCSGSTVST